MTKERQIKQKLETSNEILKVAKQIIEKDGIEALSIRKITNQLGYSPALIYHYFKDKDEIINTLVIEGYQKIVTSVQQGLQPNKNPMEDIKDLFTSYIDNALKNPREYLAFMLSKHPDVLKMTAILPKGISEHSKTMGMLTGTVQRGIQMGIFKEGDPERMAQIIWCSCFGLVIKLIYEEDIDDYQKERLVDEHFEMMFNGLKK